MNTTDKISTIIDADFDAEVAFLAELVRVASDNPPGNCVPHAAKAAALLEQLGYTVEKASRAGRNGAGGRDDLRDESHRASSIRLRRPCIALNAHGDVVPPGLGWSQEPYGAAILDDTVHGPTMYGRGVAVSKSGFRNVHLCTAGTGTTGRRRAEGQRHGGASFHLRRGSRR